MSSYTNRALFNVATSSHPPRRDLIVIAGFEYTITLSEQNHHTTPDVGSACPNQPIPFLGIALSVLQ